jgi:predicted transcriptional regulator
MNSRRFIYDRSMSRKPLQNANASEDPDEILLAVLNAVEDNATTSQRTISRELGIALGLANAYLKRCVGKGWIKIKQIPPRRYAYYLTPKGFAEKTRLTADYFSASFTFFRRAREQMSQILAQCVAQGYSRIAFAGASELAEVGTLCARDYPVSIVGVVEPTRPSGSFYGLPVRSALQDLGLVDVVIVTSVAQAEATFRNMEKELGRGRVLAPKILGLRAAPSAPVPGAAIRAAE